MMGLEQLSVYMTETPAKDKLYEICDKTFASELKKLVVPYLSEFYVECKTEVTPDKLYPDKSNFYLTNIPKFGIHIIKLAIEKKCMEHCAPEIGGYFTDDGIIYLTTSKYCDGNASGFEETEKGSLRYLRRIECMHEYGLSTSADLTIEQLGAIEAKIKYNYKNQIHII